MLSNLLPAFLHHMLSVVTLLVLFGWVVSLAGAALAFWLDERQPTKTLRSFLVFCFPSAIWRHRSCRADFLFIAVGKLVHPFFITPFMFSNVLFGTMAYGWLTDVFGSRPQDPPPFWLWVALLIFAILVWDFITFYVHYIMHKIGPLWELHKVHHASEFLIPITNRRVHPWQEIIDNLTSAVCAGALMGVASYAFSMPITDASLLGVDVYFFINLFSFYHLRHSHIYLSYGWLEKHILSPAQHQIHHSRHRRHWDKNFGLLLSWWDRWFGTLVLSGPAEVVDLGLPDEYKEDYNSVLKLYLTPLRNLAHMFLRHVRGWVGTGRSQAGFQALAQGSVASGSNAVVTAERD
jgi:sterol desaturase/sphingolipid hydroxylase (fatty acid hydroxylase superfamily)